MDLTDHVSEAYYYGRLFVTLLTSSVDHKFQLCTVFLGKAMWYLHKPGGSRQVAIIAVKHGIMLLYDFTTELLYMVSSARIGTIADIVPMLLNIY